MEKLQKKEEKGITIIALTITIIVLITLAGVAINLILGQNGLLNRTKEAREKYEIASAKEYIELKIDECIIEKGGEASLQDIIDYLAEDSSVTYYVALEEVGLVAGEVCIGSPKEIYVVYNRYQFKVDESKKVEFISIVDVDLEGKVSIEAQVKEHLGKNADGKYEASVLLKATGDAEIAKLEIENPDGTTLTLEPDGLTTVGKDITIEFDKTYKVILTTANGHKYTKKIIEKTEEIIMNAEQLASFRDKVNSGLTYEGKTVKLGVDIDLSTVCGANVNEKEISWEPIGNYGTDQAHYFSGTFNGNNHKINFLYINTTNSYQGLFGLLNNGKITDIVIENNSVIRGNSYIGGIAGEIINSEVLNCGNNCNIEGTSNLVGGITGKCSNSEIIASYNKGNVMSNGNTTGGISGSLEANNDDKGIKYSYNTGNIEAGYYVGGIIGNGNDYAKIYNCYNKGSVQANSTNGSSNVGGIAGRLRAYGLITYSYNLGSVINNNSGIRSGGIVGQTAAYDGTTDTNARASTVSYSYNSADVTSIGQYIGGICGQNGIYCFVKNSYISDTVNVKYNKTSATTNIGSSSNYVGKIIGKAYSNTSTYINAVGILSTMPTVYKVVNGLNDGTSQYWSNERLNEPKLLWEINNTLLDNDIVN